MTLKIRNSIEDDLRSLNPTKDREIYIFRTIAKDIMIMQQIFVPMISVILGCKKIIDNNAGTKI